MIVNTKTGLLIGGALIKDAGARQAGSKQVLKFPVRYGFEEPSASGERGDGKILDVDVWDGVAALDGMLCKGDAVIVTAKEVKSREYQGKTYYSVSATGLYPSAEAVLRWMQQAIDIMHGEMDELRAEIAELKARPVPRDATAGLSGHELYEGEKLSDYAPQSGNKQEPAQTTEPPIDESEDLPF